MVFDEPAVVQGLAAGARPNLPRGPGRYSKIVLQSLAESGNLNAVGVAISVILEHRVPTPIRRR